MGEEKEICEELSIENKGDYLTGVAVEGATDIVKNIEDIEKKVTSIKSAIEAKKAEIAARENENNDGTI